MDRVVVLLGVVMIGLTSFVAINTQPPVGEALRQTIAPEIVSFLVITTLIGGTVGGYIVSAGAHRLVDNGIKGEEFVPQITRSSIVGVLITGLMWVLLFLAILGVVAGGKELDPSTRQPRPSSRRSARPAESCSASSSGRRPSHR